MAIVERFKQESMYGLSAKKKCGHCGEVAVSGGSTVLSFLLISSLEKITGILSDIFCVLETENPNHFTLTSFNIQLTVISD